MDTTALKKAQYLSITTFKRGGLDGYLTQVITGRSGRRIVVAAANSTGANSSAAKTELPVELYCRSSRRMPLTARVADR